MKLLLFSDLHADKPAAARLVALAKKQRVDVLVGAGDFGNMRRGVSVCIEVLRTAEQPAILVPGNNESYEELVKAGQRWPNAQVLHGSGTTIQNQSFWGLGGGVPITPFGAWSYDFTETEAKTMLAPCPPQAILVSHSPPYGILDRSSSRSHLGSQAVRQTIEKHQPQLVVCGHIHHSAGQTEWLGKTPVVNAGPDGVIWTLDE